VQKINQAGGGELEFSVARERNGPAALLESERKSKRGPHQRSSETLKDVVNRKGSLQEGYLVLERLQQSPEKGGSAKPLSAKFFSLLMSLCVANIRAGRASLDDAYGVMRRCEEANVEPDTILYNALLAAVSQEAGRGRASLSQATAVMKQAAPLRNSVALV
jgi:hypothetical protein